ncbi:hypothetical protein V2J09_011984 [Rumex salicifolius]
MNDTFSSSHELIDVQPKLDRKERFQYHAFMLIRYSKIKQLTKSPISLSSLPAFFAASQTSTVAEFFQQLSLYALICGHSKATPYNSQVRHLDNIPLSDRGSSKGSWRPELTTDTTTTNYWLNWRTMLCAFWLLLAMLFASFLISRYEGPQRGRRRRQQTIEEEEENNNEDDDEPGILYEDEVWKPCLKGMHPAWLLAYRTLAFFVLLILLILNVTFDGADIMYYYTQWTFTLVTIYFGLGSLLSMYGCFEYHNKVGSNENILALPVGVPKSFYVQARHYRRQQPPRKIAGFWAYVFQIIFQMNAGAVVLTDCVFWFIILPFLATKNYDINFVSEVKTAKFRLIVNMHTINAVFLLGDTAMNCLVPMVQNRLLLPLDFLLRRIPMDSSCLHISMVLFCWNNALSLLWFVCLGDQDEAFFAVKLSVSNTNLADCILSTPPKAKNTTAALSLFSVESSLEKSSEEDLNPKSDFILNKDKAPFSPLSSLGTRLKLLID